MKQGKLPTQEQSKEFWEWCGFEDIFEEDTGACYWKAPNGDAGVDLPPVDLINLFKYAVPKLYELGYWMQWFLDDKGCDVRIHHLNTQDNHSIYQEKDPALALFWAVWKVITYTIK